MIPYAVLCGKIYSEDGTATDIRVLELTGDSYSFRMPVGFRTEHGEFTHTELSFYDWETKQYSTVRLKLSDGTVKCSQVEAAEYYDVYRVDTQDSSFNTAAVGLARDYLKYIDCKLNLDDEDMSAAMAGYPADIEDIYSDSYEAQIEHFACEIMSRQDAIADYDRIAASGLSEICCSIENMELVDMYLRMRTDEFIVSLFKENHLENHPFAHVKITRLYIGNEYCSNIRYDTQVLARLIGKAAEEGLAVTIALPPVSALKYREYCEYADTCVELARGAGIEQYEFCVNDQGMYQYIRERYAEATVIPGVLMDKYRRDPRAKYAQDIECGVGHVEYYPYYQTNTGTFCPLYAAVNNGSRGNQERVKACRQECAHHAFLYPEHLNMIGRYNSLFGVNTQGMSHIPGRVVINL